MPSACAGGLGGAEAFEAMHDRLLEEPSAWRGGVDTGAFEAMATEAGLPAARFADCLSRDVPAQLIMADSRAAAAFGVQGTPTFVVLPRGAESVEEAVVFYGNEPMARFHEAIGDARARAR